MLRIRYRRPASRRPKRKQSREDMAIKKGPLQVEATSLCISEEILRREPELEFNFDRHLLNSTGRSAGRLLEEAHLT
jgi:hypothetical protein